MLPHAAPRAAVALGCVSGVLLAASAFLAGALPSGDPGAGLRLGGFGAVSGGFLTGLACWLFGMAGWTAAWWRLGRWAGAIGLNHADPQGARPGRRAGRRLGVDPQGWRLLAIGAAWAAPLLVAPTLGSRDAYAYACQGWLWRAGLDPYAMGVADGGCPWTSAVPELWWHTPTPYGPVGVLLSAAVTGVGGLLGALAGLRLLTLAALALLAFALHRLARACAVPAPAAWWLALLSPLTAVHALSALHNDALVAALTAAALALAAPLHVDLARMVVPPSGSRVSSPPFTQDRRAGGPRAWGAVVGAGVVVALAVGVKVTAVVAVPFVLVLVGRRWWAAVAAGVGTFAAVSLGAGLGLGWVAALRGTGELAQWSSPPTAVGMSAGYLLRLAGRGEWYDGAVAVGRVLGLVALAGVGVWALWHAWRRRGDTGAVVRACGWLMAATALLGPVFYPWYALAPLAVLAAAETDPRRRRWLAVGAVACALLTLPNGLGVPVLTKAVGAFAVTAALVVTAVRSRPTATA